MNQVHIGSFTLVHNQKKQKNVTKILPPGTKDLHRKKSISVSDDGSELLCL